MSANVITDDQFKHIAKLSRLEIKPEESYIKDQLSEAAGYVEVLKELDTDKISPTFQVNHKTNVFRDDMISPSLTQSQAISQAPKTKDGYIVTAATIKK
jgi:aspartyl-tRNA(Asn)/glutamyl-tRNA(Gln) amidotransferase subunit C